MATEVLRRLFSVEEFHRIYDRRVKVPRYAQTGIPAVWVVDLRDGAIDASRQPHIEGVEERNALLLSPVFCLVSPVQRQFLRTQHPAPRTRSAPCTWHAAPHVAR